MIKYTVWITIIERYNYLKICVLIDFTSSETGNLAYRSNIDVRVIKDKQVNAATSSYTVLAKVIVKTVLWC